MVYLLCHRTICPSVFNRFDIRNNPILPEKKTTQQIIVLIQIKEINQNKPYVVKRTGG